MKKLWILALLAVTFTTAQAQINWPDDEALRAQLEEKNARFNDGIRSDRWEYASVAFHWMVENWPTFNEGLYINGAKMLLGQLEGVAEDDPRRLVLADSLMLVFDLRMEHFGKESSVLNRKAYRAYQHYSKEPARSKEFYDILNEAFETTGADFNNSLLAAYMLAIRTRHLEDEEKMPREKVIQKYFTIKEYLSNAEAAGDDPEKLEQVNGQVDKVFLATVPLDCESIDSEFVERLRNDPTNVALAKNTFSLLYAKDCKEGDSFLFVAETLLGLEPNYTLAKLVGGRYLVASDYDKAEEYYTQAAELAESAEKKGETTMELAKMAARRGLLSKARSQAYEAANLNPDMASAAYTFIGDLYFGSFDRCKGGQSIVDDRAVYIAAYEMYQKAGNGSAMAKAEGQFPSMEEIFTEGKSLGQSVTVGCWINETVELRKRP